MSSRKFLIATGGTGGHLLPAQQLATLLQKKGDTVIFAGHLLSKNLYFQKKFPFQDIVSAPIGVRCIFSMLIGLFQSIRLLMEEKPDKVIGFGSYHSAPILIAAVLLRKPIIIYEANRILGKVNRIMAPFAKKVFVQFPLMYPLKNQSLVPLFPWIKEEKGWTKELARRELGLKESVFTVLVFGGSQGAHFLNETVPQILPFLNRDVQIIHLAGSTSEAEKLKKKYPNGHLILSFEKEMAKLYAASDFVICRSGAATVAELLFYQIPSILIPYPFSADRHQELNANYLVELGNGFMLHQAETTPQKIAEAIQNAKILAMQGKMEQNRVPIEEQIYE